MRQPFQPQHKQRNRQQVRQIDNRRAHRRRIVPVFRLPEVPHASRAGYPSLELSGTIAKGIAPSRFGVLL